MTSHGPNLTLWRSQVLPYSLAEPLRRRLIEHCRWVMTAVGSAESEQHEAAWLIDYVLECILRCYSVSAPSKNVKIEEFPNFPPFLLLPFSLCRRTGPNLCTAILATKGRSLFGFHSLLPRRLRAEIRIPCRSPCHLSVKFQQTSHYFVNYVWNGDREGEQLISCWNSHATVVCRIKVSTPCVDLVTVCLARLSIVLSRNIECILRHPM